MIDLQRISLMACFCTAAILGGCASKAKPQPVNEQVDLSAQSDVILAAPPKPRFRDRLRAGAEKGTMSAAKGGVNVVKGVAVVTANGVDVAAKGAAAGARIGGRAAVGTSDIIVHGTRQTASRFSKGLGFIMTAPAANDAASPVGNKSLADAALSPLSDLNLRKRERPEVLMRLEAEDLYLIDDDIDCAWFDVRVDELDEVLGADYDVTRDKDTALNRAGKAGRGAAISSVASAAGSYIPGRGIVRSLSGAKARQKKTRQVYQKGVARRAFLKGVAMTKGCEGY